MRDSFPIDITLFDYTIICMNYKEKEFIYDSSMLKMTL